MMRLTCSALQKLSYLLNFSTFTLQPQTSVYLIRILQGIVNSEVEGNLFSKYLNNVLYAVVCVYVIFFT